MGSDRAPFRSILDFAIGGGWGSATERAEDTPVVIIRGTDFARVRHLDLDSCPRRFETSRRATKRELKGGDLVLEISGGSPTSGQSTGRSLLVTDAILACSEHALIPASFCRLIRVNQRRVRPRYAFYLLQDMWHAGRARKYENQSTGISNFQFEYFLDEERVWIPALPVQDRILGLIGTLDDKIDSNVRVNRTLDAFAQALMQQLVARPHAATEHTAPNATLGDALSVLETGSRPSGGVKGITSGIPSIGAESIVGAGIFDFSKVKFIPQDFYAGLKRGSIEDRDVLLYKDGGRPGNFEPHVSIVGEGFPFRYAAINEHVYRLRVRSPYSQDFLYLWLRSDWLADEMRRRGTGVAVPGLNSTAVKALPLITPDLENLAQMQDAVAPLLTLILSNANESRRLSELRDALLARTVSGRMLVPDTGDPQEVVGSMVEQALS